MISKNCFDWMQRWVGRKIEPLKMESTEECSGSACSMQTACQRAAATGPGLGVAAALPVGANGYSQQEQKTTISRRACSKASEVKAAGQVVQKTRKYGWLQVGAADSHGRSAGRRKSELPVSLLGDSEVETPPLGRADDPLTAAAAAPWQAWPGLSLASLFLIPKHNYLKCCV